MLLNKKIVLLMSLISFIGFSSSLTYAARATYDEQQFLGTFSGKSRKLILEKLGNPDKKEQSVKPSNANSIIAGKGKESSKPVNVEMWYYNNRVSYAPNKNYKFTELTFVNDRCMNIAFFNNR
ncbi:MAG: hypothetical protein RLZZ151_298 [Pseudomonadota bacterium]|jgi:hypothetical protein